MYGLYTNDKFEMLRSELEHNLAHFDTCFSQTGLEYALYPEKIYGVKTKNLVKNDHIYGKTEQFRLDSMAQDVQNKVIRNSDIDSDDFKADMRFKNEPEI